MSTMLSEEEQFLLLPKAIVNPARASVYERLFFRLKEDSMLCSSIENNPDILLKLIEDYAPSQSSVDQRREQYSEIVQRFSEGNPACVLYFGVEEDCGYSIIYLSKEFARIKPDVRVYAVYDITRISRRDLLMVNLLMKLSGIKQIQIFDAVSTLESFLADLNRNHRFEWVILNHENNTKDIDNVKMLETLSLIQPRMTMLKVNDFSDEGDDLETYLLSTPMIKRLYSMEFSVSKYLGRWNLLYDKVSDMPKLYKCTEFLDS
ncbi:hypothetical protein FOA43_002066 [Brettanomyces nanus]|uniref:Uncharacterized protein n=1 Tax=Eeniella nana TaxID=13502 RepID=A0A875S1E1_EENNA|nr:uncharacterized protein FOA43_002066 [Brettanomyces nanus]QPG74733.1 hypothetical protein FOA43_002066 [Brettanomyces nanus]